MVLFEEGKTTTQAADIKLEPAEAFAAKRIPVATISIIGKYPNMKGN